MKLYLNLFNLLPISIVVLRESCDDRIDIFVLCWEICGQTQWCFDSTPLHCWPLTRNKRNIETKWRPEWKEADATERSQTRLKEKPREPQEDGDGSTFHTNDDKLDASSSSRASRDNSKSCIASYEKVVTIGSKIVQPVTCKPGCQVNAITVDLPGGGSKIIVVGCS